MLIHGHVKGTPRPDMILMIEGLDDPEERAAALRRRARFNRNADWLEANGDAVFEKYRGRCICVAGEEVFTADTATEAIAKAQAAHPDDDGWFIHQVPSERAIRIYADRR